MSSVRCIMDLSAVVLAAGRFIPPGSPAAHRSSVIDAGSARFTVLSPWLLRLEYSQDHPPTFEDLQTYVAINRLFPPVDFRATIDGSMTTIDTGKLKLQYSGGAFTGRTLKIDMSEPNWFNVTTWTPESSTDGNLFGTFHHLDRMDGWQDMNCSHAANGDGADYAHWWCTMGLVSKSGWATVDDSRSPLLAPDLDWLIPQRKGHCLTSGAAKRPCFRDPTLKLDQNECEAAGCCWSAGSSTADDSCYQSSGNADMYFFGHGVGHANYRQALKDFTLLAGAVPMPRRHQLGMSWSRWSTGLGDVWPGTQKMMMEAVEGLAAAHFPLDQFVFDMNWHQKSTGWTGYTWDTRMYPNHVGLLDWLHARGLYTAANLHDSDGVSPLEARYPAMASAMGQHDAKSIPFHYSNSTYARSLHELVLRPLAEEGLDFWWTDWQSKYGGGAQPDIQGYNPTMLMNHHRFLNPQPLSAASAAINGGLRRGATLRGATHSRFGGIGGHRYITQFGGDVEQTWASLSFFPYHVSTAANVAVAYWAEEIMNGQGTAVNHQLFARVIQFGAWSPVFTTWGNNDDPNNLWQDHDFPSPYRNASQLALAHRAMLMPYRYTLSFLTHRTSVAMIQPMYYQWPWAEQAYPILNDGSNSSSRAQFMLGESILVAPVVSPLGCGYGNCSSDVANTTFWIPPDTEWVPVFSNSPVLPRPDARGVVTVKAALSQVLAYVRRGSVLPMLPYSDAITHGSASRPFTNIEFVVYAPVASGGACWVYEDDGLTEDYLAEKFVNISMRYTVDLASKCLNFTARSSGNYHGAPVSRNFSFRVKGRSEMLVHAPPATADHEVHAYLCGWQADPSGTNRGLVETQREQDGVEVVV